MTLMHRILRALMSPTEERMIRRLLRQRAHAWAECDNYKRRLGLRIGQVIPECEP